MRATRPYRRIVLTVTFQYVLYSCICSTVVYTVHVIYLTAILPSFSEDGSCHRHLWHLSADGTAAIAIFAIFQKMVPLPPKCHFHQNYGGNDILGDDIQMAC